MRKFLWTIVAAFTVYNCAGLVDTSNPLNFSATSFELDADGSAKTFSVFAKEGSWHVTPSESWLHVDPSSGTAGSTKVSVSADANTMETGRSAALQFTMPGYFNGEISLPVSQAAGSSGQGGCVVTTGAASGIGKTEVTLNGEFSGATGTVGDHGFYYGTTRDCDNQVGLNSHSGTSGSFSATVQNLSAGTTYYYKAYVTEFDGTEYVDRFGAVLSFTTEQGSTPPSPASGLQYLGGYEIPAVSLVSTESFSDSGMESVNSAKWYNYETTNPDQKIVTHTFPYQGKIYRNYTILFDRDKKAALWNAFVMHDDVYGEDNNVGRSGSWKVDPALPSDWQSCFSSSGYSRGHEVASNYRQVNTDANKQTFYYSNQALQYQTQFNDGVWNNLENAVVANQPSGHDTLYVVVGLLYEDGQNLGGVPLPSHFYKCLMKCSFSTDGTMTGANGTAYIFTNEAHKGMAYSQGITSIDAIEERSGFDFFANVPAGLQEAAEKTAAPIW